MKNIVIGIIIGIIVIGYLVYAHYDNKKNGPPPSSDGGWGNRGDLCVPMHRR